MAAAGNDAHILAAARTAELLPRDAVPLEVSRLDGASLDGDPFTEVDASYPGALISAQPATIAAMSETTAAKRPRIPI